MVREDNLEYKTVLGTQYLSDREVIAAFFLPYGEEKALQIANTLYVHAKSLKNVLNLSYNELLQLGLTSKQATVITAVKSCQKRGLQDDSNCVVSIVSSQSAYNALYPIFEGLAVEHFYVLCLNQRNRIIAKIKISEGGTTGTVVDAKVLFRRVLAVPKVACIILLHNHPSGQLRPSEPDKKLTKKLKAAAEQLDIRVIDHLIITDNGYFSFADEGLLV